MNLFFAEGLMTLYEKFVDNWLGPIYLITVAIFSVVFLKDRKFRELFSFIAIATIVAILIFFTKTFFSKEGKITTAVKSAAEGAL
jgi:hypothetical protein